MLNSLLSIAYSQKQSRNIPATQPQLQSINILLSTYCEGRAERLALLSSWFGRSFFSSKELTINEASALIELAFNKNGDEWKESPSFSEFIQNSLTKVYSY